MKRQYLVVLTIVSSTLVLCAMREGNFPSEAQILARGVSSRCDLESLAGADDKLVFFRSSCAPSEQIDLYLMLASPWSAHAVLPVEIARTSSCSMMPFLERRALSEADANAIQALLIWMVISRRASGCVPETGALDHLASRLRRNPYDLMSQVNIIMIECIVTGAECGPILKRAREQRE